MHFFRVQCLARNASHVNKQEVVLKCGTKDVGNSGRVVGARLTFVRSSGGAGALGDTRGSGRGESEREHHGLLSRLRPQAPALDRPEPAPHRARSPGKLNTINAD